MKFVAALYSLMFLTCVFEIRATAPDSIRTEQRPEGLFVIHQVDEEETLYSIAKRYGSRIRTIIEFNDVQNDRIEVGQILSVLINRNVAPEEVQPQLTEEIEQTGKNTHLVKQGETLYSIARFHNIRVQELKKLNKLESNALSPGQVLRMKAPEPAPQVIHDDSGEITSLPPNQSLHNKNDEIQRDDTLETYLVQTGETLYTIASKLNVSVADLKRWNKMISDYLRIGQKLGYKKSEIIEGDEPNSTEARVVLNEDGFEKIFEEGIASVIEEMSTVKYLALHRTLPIGTQLEVRNLMNNFKVYVKVVGKLPDTGVNENIVVRLSGSAYETLGVVDPRIRVEISYFKE